MFVSRLYIGVLSRRSGRPTRPDCNSRNIDKHKLLARTLRLPVFGSIKPLMKSHYDEHGFNPTFAHVLVEASELV